MWIRHAGWLPAIGIAIGLTLGHLPEASGQSTPGTTQQAFQRNQARMQSMQQNQAGRINAGQHASIGVGGTTQQSIQRQQAMMQSMHQNLNARRIGMQQQVIHRTPDNLHGVYWNNRFARSARERSVYSQMLRLPTSENDLMRLRLWQAQEADNQLRREIEAAQLVELQRRQQQRRSVPSATATFPGADMLGQAQNPGRN
ncbi:hypothetical protein BH23PLA1_BH23PLA1_19410 [soil metagenome]